MIFLRHIKYPSSQITSSAEDPLAETLTRLPAIMPRSGMGFYIIDLFEVWKFHFQFLLFIIFFHMKYGSTSNYLMLVLLKTIKTSIIRFFISQLQLKIVCWSDRCLILDSSQIETEDKLWTKDCKERNSLSL